MSAYEVVRPVDQRPATGVARADRPERRWGPEDVAAYLVPEFAGLYCCFRGLCPGAPGESSPDRVRMSGLARPLDADEAARDKDLPDLCRFVLATG